MTGHATLEGKPMSLNLKPDQIRECIRDAKRKANDMYMGRVPKPEGVKFFTPLFFGDPDLWKIESLFFGPPILSDHFANRVLNLTLLNAIDVIIDNITETEVHGSRIFGLERQVISDVLVSARAQTTILEWLKAWRIYLDSGGRGPSSLETTGCLPQSAPDMCPDKSLADEDVLGP